MATPKELEAIRSEIENSDGLDLKTARKLFEKPFKEILSKLDDETRESLFMRSIEEVKSLSGGKIIYSTAFNTYVGSVALLEQVANTPLVETEENISSQAMEIFNASNRLGTLFYSLRKQQDIPLVVGRQMIEAAFPLATNGLSLELREAVFQHASDRGSADGWGEVVEQYTDFIDFVAFVKPGNHSEESENDS